MAAVTDITIVNGIPTAGSGTVASLSKFEKAASTAPLATDPALVVSISPNSVNANGQATMANSAPVVIASNQSAVPVSGTVATTPHNLLAATGTNGFIATPFALLNASDTGLNALASGGSVTSANGGTSGKFSQTNFGSAKKALIWLNVVTAGWTPTAGAVITGWFLHSTDGGTTFESLVSTPSTTVAALPRAPDFVIPAYQGGTALAAGNVLFSALVNLPYDTVKIVLQNNTGAAFGAGAHTVFCGPVADAS